MWRLYFVQAFMTLKDMDESGVETLSYGEEQACNSQKIRIGDKKMKKELEELLKLSHKRTSILPVIR